MPVPAAWPLDDEELPPLLAPADVLALASSLRGPKLLYQNGEAVWTKGGKPPPTEEKEEWDGGSRGKVITKGKRGPGFR